MKLPHRLADCESVLGLLICPLELRCRVCIKLADARLSLLPGRNSVVGPDEFVRGTVKCATGTAFSGVTVEVVAALLLDVVALSVMDGMTRLVRVDRVSEGCRECRMA